MEETAEPQPDSYAALQCLEVLRTIPESVHLLCPRQSDDDDRNYDAFTAIDDAPQDREEDPEITRLIKEAKERRDTTFACFECFAWTGADATPYQDMLRRRIDHILKVCNLCIMQYYRGKRQYFEKLRDDYDDDAILEFSQTFDEWELKRIIPMLHRITKRLHDLPPQSRRLAVLDTEEVMTIAESLCCEALLTNESLLKEHLDEPFQMIQGKKGLGIRDYVPATTRFLFDSNPVRCTWARQIWRKFEHSPTEWEFDWTMKDSLVENLRKGAAPDVSLNQVHRLWFGLHLILDKLDKDRIVHSLRALDQDFCRIMMDHFHKPTAGLRFLLHAFQSLLEKAPGVFWESMGSISSTTVIEQIFNNPQLDEFMLQTNEEECFETSALKDILGWVDPFLRSLQSANQVDACRLLAFQLLTRLQESRFPITARSHCYLTGVSVLRIVTGSFAESRPDQQSVARVILSNIQDIIGEYANMLIEPPSHVAGLLVAPREDRLPPHIEVISRSLEFDCGGINDDFKVLQSSTDLDHAIISCSSKVWSAVIGRVRRIEDVTFAKGVVVAFTPLMGPEPFKSRERLIESKARFNQTFEEINGFIGQILEHIADYAPEKLDDLLKAIDTATPLIASLFSADETVGKVGVQLLKNVSGQSGRKEAINHLIQAFFATAMHAFSFAYRRIAALKTFASALLMVKTGKDLIDILCDPQSGIIRTRVMANRRDISSVEKLWGYLWQAIATVFENMEHWSRTGTALDREANMEFCRDTMQLAELLFQNYAVFAGALCTANSAEGDGEKSASSIEKSLLKYPAFTFKFTVLWLRFKDEYLAATSHKLILLLMGRLGEHGLTIDERTLTAIENFVVKDKNGKDITKSILTPQQKAELVRAWEKYTGRSWTIKGPDAPKKVGKQSTLGAWAKSKPLESSDDFGDSDLPDEEILEISKSAELKEAHRAAQKRDALKTGTPALSKRPKKPDVDVVSFREKREREKEEKKKRDAAEIARQKRQAALAAGDRDRRTSLPGVEGKDHSEDNMMVSSESDSDVEEVVSVFGPSVRRNEKGAANGLVAEKLLRKHGPVKKVKQLRSAKDMRARLTPDLSHLHRTILSWNFFSGSDVPPSSTKTDYSLVSSVFRTPSDYQNTFQPLLILEAWQGFRKDKEEGVFKAFAIKVASRLSVDSFVEVTSAMQVKEAQDLQLGESDIVLISKGKNPASDSSQPHCLARISRTIRQQGMLQIVYRVNANNPLLSSLSPASELYGAKISSLTPLEREYAALSALQYYDLCDEIIKAKPSPMLEYSEKALATLVTNYQINQAQAKAIKSALDNDAFTLIQGPPGSGKTKTIVALVGALMTGSLVNQGVSISQPSSTSSRPTQTIKKLLICAPSNAAVDEIVMRLKEGVRTLNGRNEKLSVVRLGRTDAINANVKDVTLDELVQARLSTTSVSKTRTTHDIMMEHKATSEQVNRIRDEMDVLRAKNRPVSAEMEREFELLKKKRNQLGTEIDSSRDKDNTSNRDSELNRRRIQQEILDGAHVICSTLSGSGHDMFQTLSIEFETVIIDEAAQSIELSALIPLKYGCSKCILVGDPKQLPPTVLSREAAKFQYEQSLFVRMQTNHPKDVHLLDTQYRMHPEISRFPSKTFYDSKLQDGPGMAKTRTRPWHQSGILAPYRFFDVLGTQQNASKGHSLINMMEVRVAVQLYTRLITDCRGYDFGGKVGIITPYKSQLRELRNTFCSHFGNEIFNRIEFNTTDAFQGRENEIIIFSCVRASTGGIGFLADIRRMNVGLTRAKCSLWVLGNSSALSQGEFWNALVTDSRSRGLYTGGDVMSLLAKPVLVVDVEMTDAFEVESAPSSANPAADHPSAKLTSRRSSMAMTPHDSPELEDKPILAEHRGNDGQSSKKAPDKSTGPSKIKKDNSKQDEVSKNSKNSKTDSSRTKVENVPPLATSLTEQRPTTGRRSGGTWMINDVLACSYCGSSNHYSHDCDNSEALAASRGVCNRCGSVEHLYTSCTALRCRECGGFGHVGRDCSGTKLPKDQKRRLEKYESSWEEKKRHLENRRKKQLGDHDPKIPTVMPTGSSNANPKRKRGDSLNGDPGVVERRQDMGNHSSKHAANGTTSGSSGPRNGPQGLRADRVGVRPPKKKAPADPFIRPKQRPQPR